jgi:ligand-binding sensor domain-containing protein
MKKTLSLFIGIIAGVSWSRAQLQPIGQWRSHLSYNQAIAVTSNSNGLLYCATPYAIFSVDINDNTIERFSKINGLHEVGVQTIQSNAAGDKLVVAYTNSNIDIIAGSKIYNIPDIKLKEIAADKTINNVYSYNGLAYLSTGMGIIVLDENKYEVKDTYIIGNNGNFSSINGITRDNNYFYAASNEGLKTAPVNAVNLADYRNWQLVTDISGSGINPNQNVLNLTGHIIVQQNDSLFFNNNGTWNLWFADGWSIIQTNSTENHLTICEQKGNQSRVLVLNPDASIAQTVTENNVLLAARQSIFLQNTLWVADSISGLLEYSNANARRYQPNSPFAAASGELVAKENTLWAAAGTVTANWTNTFNKNGLFRFAHESWTNFNSYNNPVLDSIYDIITTAIDPRDHSVWAGSFGAGLLQIKGDNSIQIFKQSSGLAPSNSDPSKYFIAGLAFDNDNNLWITDYGATQNLAVLKADGSWKTWFVPFSLSNNAVGQIIVDIYNQKWIVSPGGNGLVCFNHGQTIDNYSDDQWKIYKTGAGQGNLPDNHVLCIASDKNGFIWVGTTKGIGIIQCPQQVFNSQSCDAIIPIVQQDNFAGYLFGDQQVQCIAVDAADRKWVGTKNGLWLLSPEGDNIVYQFTSDNSPLLDNNVQKIAVDGISGEVFISTGKGICSFRSTAIDGGTQNANVLVFPNPVPPGYGGSIAIKGLVDNATVKITELNGRLVYQTRALGGQAIWNGKDYTGRTIATGVYLVLVSDDSRQEKIATKIVFISK